MSELSALVYFIDAVLFTLAVGSVIFFGLEDVSENWRRAMEKQGLAESKFPFLADQLLQTVDSFGEIKNPTY